LEFSPLNCLAPPSADLTGSTLLNARNGNSAKAELLNRVNKKCPESGHFIFEIEWGIFLKSRNRARHFQEIIHLRDVWVFTANDQHRSISFEYDLLSSTRRHAFIAADKSSGYIYYSELSASF
jgi:hypothetical protein